MHCETSAHAAFCNRTRYLIRMQGFLFLWLKRFSFLFLTKTFFIAVIFFTCYKMLPRIYFLPWNAGASSHGKHWCKNTLLQKINIWFRLGKFYVLKLFLFNVSWKNTATIQMQIEDQSFIHEGDRRLLSESFPKFFRKSIMVCNVHLSVFTMESKYFENRQIWMIV